MFILDAAVCIALALAPLAKHKLTKVCNKKMQFVNLAEHIDFKEAKTVEEGIKFAKEVLKIGEVDNKFTLEAINFVNKGLVDVSNANNGKLFMPKKMVFAKRDKAYAGVCGNILSSRFATLSINSKYFDNKFMNEQLNKFLTKKDGEKAFEILDDNKMTKTLWLKKSGIKMGLTNDVKALVRKFYENPDNLNIEDKRSLYFSIKSSIDELKGQIERYPLSTIKQYKPLFEKHLKTKIDVESISKKTTKEQSEILSGYTSKMAEVGHILRKDVELISLKYQIYHEMGHLQDFATNLKNLDLHIWEISAFRKNRWGGLTYKGYNELLQNKPAKFVKRYPNLYEHLTNQEVQQTAGKVSWYAQTSIGEFVAETYAKMVRGDKIPKDVINLYEKYNGPSLGAYNNWTV